MSHRVHANSAARQAAYRARLRARAAEPVPVPVEPV